MSKNNSKFFSLNVSGYIKNISAMGKKLFKSLTYNNFFW